MNFYKVDADTIVIQLEEYTQKERDDTFSIITRFIATDLKLSCKYNHNSTECTIYCGYSIIATITKGNYTIVAENQRLNIYYSSIKFAGLLSHNKEKDSKSNDFLFAICSYLYRLEITYKVTELDVCVDIPCSLREVVCFPIKHSPNVLYYGLLEKQKFYDTVYIEKINNQNLNRAVSRSYYYNKSAKESLPYSLTRFEIKLQSKFFNSHELHIYEIMKQLDKYAIMHIKDTSERNFLIEEHYRRISLSEDDIYSLGYWHLKAQLDFTEIHYFIYLLNNPIQYQPSWSRQ